MQVDLTVTLTFFCHCISSSLAARRSKLLGLVVVFTCHSSFSPYYNVAPYLYQLLRRKQIKSRNKELVTQTLRHQVLL